MWAVGAKINIKGSKIHVGIFISMNQDMILQSLRSAVKRAMEKNQLATMYVHSEETQIKKKVHTILSKSYLV